MRGRRFQRGQRGVAAVIGTLLALLVFMTLFGLFLTQFLPIWMTDNEAMLANEVSAQLGQVKQCMDLLALYQGSGPRTCSSPVTMQSGGIPIFASPTQGTLAFETLPQLYTNVTFNDTVIGPSTPMGNLYQNFSPGEVVMNLPDRYYTPVTYVVTMGGLFQDQGGNQQTLLYQPSIEVTPQGSQVALSMTFYAMYGNSTRLQSTGTNEIYMTYIGETTYDAGSTAVNVSFSTYYPCAWQSYLGAGLKSIGEPVQYSPASCPTNVGFNQIYQMHAYFPPSVDFSLTIVSFSVAMGIGNPT